MKRFLAFLCTLMLLAQPMGFVHAEGETSPTNLLPNVLSTDAVQCADCGGDAQFTQWVERGDGHVKACPHGVVDEASFQAHQYEWKNSDAEHWQACVICGAEDPTSRGSHYQGCNPVGQCGACGLSYSEGGITHKFTDPTSYDHDETEHWQVCAKCGEKLNIGSHFAGCDKPDKCAVCGIEYKGDMIFHTFSDDHYEHNETEHWKVCSVCKQNVYIYGHVERCGNPGKCNVCGADYTGDSIFHASTDSTYYHDETKHWQVCSECGETLGQGNHFAMCNKLGKCAGCGIDYAGENVSHVGSRNWQTSETEHWQTCSACNKEVANTRRSHYGNAECTKEVHECLACKAPYVPTRLRHNYSEEKYDHNKDGHWPICLDCGDPLYGDEYIRRHLASCDSENPTVCDICGATDVETGVEHDYESNPTYGHNKMTHWRICSVCGQEEQDRFSHTAPCSAPNKCEDCGATDVVIDVDHRRGFTDEYEFDQTSHWRQCSICKEIRKYNHTSSCDDPTTCDECGAKNIEADYTDHCYPEDYSYDATHHWLVCTECGEIYEPEEHSDACDDRDGICNECCQPFTTGAYEHWNDHDMLMADADKHWFVCNTCFEVMETEEHYMICTLPDLGVCFMCGEPCTKVEHVELSEIKNDANNHWFECEECHEKVELAAHTPSKDDPAKCGVCGAAITTVHTHDWVTTETAATCLKDGSIVTSCACGEFTTEVIPAKGHDWAEAAVTAATCTKKGSSSSVCKNCDELSVSEIDALGHSWAVTDRLAPTCTADGYRVSTCSVCGADTTATLAATGHNYDIVVYASQNNGAHGTDCLNGCGAKKTEKCNLVTTTIGNMLCSACAVCGYAEYTMQSATSDLAGSDTAAEIEIVRIENAVIAPVAAEEAPLPEDTELVVHLTVPAVPIELDSEVQGKVEKLFAVNLVSEGTSIQPTGKVRLSIPYEETEELDVNVMKLMLLCEDGTLMEIEYELIDGMIVFDTDLVGVFALMRADELL